MRYCLILRVTVTAVMALSACHTFMALSACHTCMALSACHTFMALSACHTFMALLACHKFMALSDNTAHILPGTRTLSTDVNME